MNIKRVYIGVLMLSSLIMSSCHDDFLTRENENVVLTKNYWNTVEDCEIVLASVYNAFKSTDIYAFNQEALRSDLAVQGGNNRLVKEEAGLYTFNDAYNAPKNKWSALYEGIFRANQVIEGVDIVRAKLSLQNQLDALDSIEAQARFFRALFYFWLNTSFNNGDVPIIDYVPKVMPEDLYRPISDSQDVVRFLRADLISALELGMVDRWDSNQDLGRVTSMAAYTLLGMSYLYEKDYSTAQYYFKLVIDSPYHYLIEDANQATTANEFSPESILEANFSLEVNTQYSGDSALNHNFGMLVVPSGSLGGWQSIIPALWLVDAYLKEPVDIKNRENWIEVEMDTDYMEAQSGAPVANADVVYKQLGERIGDERTYLVHKFEQDGVKELANSDFEIADTERLKELYAGYRVRSYGNLLKRKTVDEDNSRTEMISDEDDYVPVEYADFTTAGNPYRKRFYIFQELDSDPITGKWYHLKDYSQRAAKSIVINGDVELSYFQNTAQSNVNFSNGNTAYFRKYSNWDTWASETDGTPANKSGINLRVMRLSDIYLMYAEALIEGGTNSRGVSEALMYVNRVRERAGVKLLGTSGEFGTERSYDGKTWTAEELMTHIMHTERPLELALDGCAMRATDLYRWGVTKERLEEVSKLHFTAVGVPSVQVDESNGMMTATNVIKFGFQVAWDEISTHGTDFVDFEQAAKNYNSSVATWHIPAVEKIANPYIN